MRINPAAQDEYSTSYMAYTHLLPAVVLAVRSQSKGDALIKRLTSEAAAAGNRRPSLEVSLLDLASFDSVRQFVERWEQQQRPLHVLINNAGMFNMGGEGQLMTNVK